ncbi:MULTISPECIES: hypothetical protein [Niastella]|uniref:Uncharacterized protein n=1 Tax=Niastella soli TaxID=2821487 RepID=A0ABS3YW31_9BACT|nr:hypothetical protein [Niastella soli]MBO9202125.1 hypothetical protein [Niastella soli]
MNSREIDVYKRIWLISGIVIEANTFTPLKNLSVLAFDFDGLLGDDCLGEGFTDEEGRYCIIFTWDDHKHLLPFQPDVYVKVYSEYGSLLKDTRNEVTRTMLYRKTIDIEINMNNEGALCLPIDYFLEMAS